MSQIHYRLNRAVEKKHVCSYVQYKLMLCNLPNGAPLLFELRGVYATKIHNEEIHLKLKTLFKIFCINDQTLKLQHPY